MKLTSYMVHRRKVCWCSGIFLFDQGEYMFSPRNIAHRWDLRMNFSSSASKIQKRKMAVPFGQWPGRGPGMDMPLHDEVDWHVPLP